MCMISELKDFKSMPSCNQSLACRKVLKVGGAVALEPAKSWGARQRAMYLNL